MNPDRDFLTYFSRDEIDKILDRGTVYINNPGNSSSPQANGVVPLNIPNTAGKRGFVRYRWKVGSGSWQQSGTLLPFGYNFDVSPVGGPSVNPNFGLRAAVSAGASDTEVKFITANGYHSDVVQYSGGNVFTAYPQLFTIEWALFSIK